MKISKRHLVTCATLLKLIKAKTRLETSQELGVEVGVVLGEVTVVAGIVARAVDGETGATTTRRNCLPRVIQQKNGDSSCMSRKKQ